MCLCDTEIVALPQLFAALANNQWVWVRHDRSNLAHKHAYLFIWGFLGGVSGEESTCQCRRHKRCGFNAWFGKILWRRKWQPIPVFLPGKFHGQWSLVGYSPWDSKLELDMAECAHARTHVRAHTHTHSYMWAPPTCTSHLHIVTLAQGSSSCWSCSRNFLFS